MGQYQTKSASGQAYNFKIKGETPSPQEMARIQAHLSEEPTAAAPTAELGVGESMLNHMRRAGAQITGGSADMFALGLDKLGIPEYADEVKGLRDYAASERIRGATLPVRDKGFFEEPTWGGKLESLAGTMVESLPPMAAGIGTALVTRSPALSAAAGSLFSIPQAMESNVQRQIQEYGEVKDWDKAGLGAIGQGLLENVADLPLGKIAGLFGKTGDKVIGDVADRAIKKAWTEAYKKTGKGIAVGTLSNFFEEGSQQLVERWQADLPLLSDEAKKEYLENAIVGGILGVAFGTVGGVSGGIDAYNETNANEAAYRTAKVKEAAATAGRDLVKGEVRTTAETALKEAMEDADADAAAMRAERAPTSPEVEPTGSPVLSPKEDHSAAVAEAEAPAAETRLPPGLREEETTAEDVAIPKAEETATPAASIAEPDIAAAARAAVAPPAKPTEVPGRRGTPLAAPAPATTTITPTAVTPALSTPPGVGIPKVATAAPSTFNEADYRKSLDKLRGVGTLSTGRVSKALGINEVSARSLMDEMIRRNDAKRSGLTGKYAKMLVPKGTVPPATGPTTSRDYSIKPILPANHAPFFAEMNGKRRSPKNFQTQDEALAWIDKNVPKGQKKSVVVAEDKASVKHGIYEGVRDDKTGTTEEKLVSTHDTEADAKDKLKDYDPAYSAVTNELTAPTPEVKKAEVERDVADTLGPYHILQNALDRMVGSSRVGLDLTDKIDDRYMASKGHVATNIGEGMVEGVFSNDKIGEAKEAIRRVISLANLTDTNLSQDQRDKRLADVLNHEVIHAIINMRLLMPGEQEALFKAAIEQKVPGKNYTWAQRAEARNPSLRREGKISALLEEGVAEMFRHYVNDPTIFKGEVRSALRKIADFVRKLIGLGRKHDAQQIMDAIFGGEIGKRPVDYGGMPPRDQRDVWYSLLKPDNFYLKSVRVIEKAKQSSATPDQWLGMLRNAGVRSEELDWMGIEWWADASSNRPVDKRELLNFINGVAGIDIELKADLPHAELSELALGIVGNPVYRDMKTKGAGTDYTEALFKFEQKDNQPEFYHGHWGGVRNVVAHARFKTIHEKGSDGINRKVLFIEEMQSDLHQSANKAGGYFSEALRGDLEKARNEYGEAADFYDKKSGENRVRKHDLARQLTILDEQLGRTKYSIRQLMREGVDLPGHRHHYLWQEEKAKEARLAAEMAGPQAEYDKIYQEGLALKEETNRKYKVWQEIVQRMSIPEAPYRTDWEDYVIKRLIRHASEHGFDAVAWHGQPESVAQAENWSGVRKTEGYESEPVETESWRPPDTTKYTLEGLTADDGGNVTPIINRYLEKLPTIVRKLAGPFGATLEYNDASETAPTSATTVHGYKPPDLNNALALEKEFPSKRSIAQVVNRMKARMARDTISTAEEVRDQVALFNSFAKAHQIALSQRSFDPAAAFHQAGLLIDDNTGTFEVDFRAPRIQEALVFTNGRGNWGDVLGFRKNMQSSGTVFPWKHFRLNLNTQMREGFTRGDVPRFSMLKESMEKIEADPRFEQWFYGSVVVDANGKPRVMYHGSRADQNFSRFKHLTHFGTLEAAHDRIDRSQIGEIANKETIGRWKGIPPAQLDAWWSALPYEEYNNLYTEFYANQNSEQRQGSRIYPVFLNLRRPLKIVDDGSNHDAFAYGLAMVKEGVLSENQFKRIMAKRVDQNNNFTTLGEKEALYSIVDVLDKAGYDGFEYTNIGEDKGSTSYVTIRSEQAKSIYNKGYWGEEEPDMMYSRLEERGRDLWQNDDKFKSWFSGSRVVDGNGDPILMFTGTSKDKDFNVFKSARNGIWFTDDPASASQYAVENDSMGFTRDDSPGARAWDMKRTNTASRVVPSFLSIKNPYIFKDEELMAWGRDPANSNYKRAQGILFDRMKANGHDGVKWGDGIWIAFNGSQIKSALSEEFSAESDSFKFSQIEPQYSVLAPLGQRVPVGPTPDNLEVTLQKATYNNIVPFMQNFFRRIGGTALLRKMGISLDSAIETGVIQLQDRMLPLGKLIDRVRAMGGTVTNENDAYLQQALMSGQVKGLIDDNERLYYQPLSKALHDLPVSTADADALARVNGAGGPAELIMKQQPDHRIGMAEVYLYAQHALERNAEMARRNAKFRAGTLQQTEGSGMTDFEAQAILNWFASKPFGAKFASETDANSIRSRYRALIAATKDVRVDGGLTPDFRTMNYATGAPVDIYKDYAPLRGFLNDHPNSVHDDNMFAKTGLGFNIRGREDPSAAGRAASTLPGGTTVYRSLGSDLIANALLQNQEAIIRAGKNKVDLAFYQVMQDNPAIMSTVATEIVHTPTKWTYNPKTGNVQQRPDPLALNQPDILKFKVKGDQKYVRIHDPRLAKAMGAKPNLGGDGLGAVMLRGMRQFNRFLAMTVTSLNPEFVVSNFEKDMTSALVNLSEYEAAGLKSKVLKSLPSVYAGVRRAISYGDRTSPIATDFWEFVEHGGMTSFQGLASLEDSIKQINEAMKLGGQGSYLTKSLGAFKAVTGAIENWNLAVENTTRLSVYIALRDHYLSQSSDPTNPANIRRAKEQAAFSAKRKTVDFNMGGEMKPVFDAFYMFYNASTQGALALVNPLIRSRRMKKVWGAVLTAGMVQDMLMSLISPEDDDGQKIYDKIPDYVLEHNMVIIDPFGLTDRGYIQIPMPYGFNAIYNLGRASGSAMRGKYSPGEAMASGLGNLFNSFNPLGEFNNVINWVAPTVLDPAVSLILNQDFTGAPIAPPASPYGPDEVASQRYWNNTSPAAVTVADWLSRAGGIVGWGRQGDMIPGLIEISPNQLAYVMEQMTGGLGATAMRAYNLVAPEAMLGKGTLLKAVQGDIDEVEVNDLPFIRKVVGSVTTKNDLQNYIKDRDKVLRVRAAIKDAAKSGDSALVKSIREKYREELKISGRVNAIENARKKLSSKINKIRDSERLTEERKQELVKKLKERQDRMVGIGNRVMQAADL